MQCEHFQDLPLLSVGGLLGFDDLVSGINCDYGAEIKVEAAGYLAAGG